MLVLLTAVLVIFAVVLFFRVATVTLVDQLSAEIARRVSAVEGGLRVVRDGLEQSAGFFVDLPGGLVEVARRVMSIEAHMARLRNGVSSLAELVFCIVPICVGVVLHVAALWQAMRGVTRRLADVEGWLRNAVVVVADLVTTLWAAIGNLRADILELKRCLGQTQQALEDTQKALGRTQQALEQARHDLAQTRQDLERQDLNYRVGQVEDDTRHLKEDKADKADGVPGGGGGGDGSRKRDFGSRAHQRVQHKANRSKPPKESVAARGQQHATSSH